MILIYIVENSIGKWVCIRYRYAYSLARANMYVQASMDEAMQHSAQWQLSHQIESAI